MNQRKLLKNFYCYIQKEVKFYLIFIFNISKKKETIKILFAIKWLNKKIIFRNVIKTKLMNSLIKY